MDFSSKEFLFFVLALMLGFYLCPSAFWRRTGLFVFNIIFILSINSNPSQLAPFILFLLVSFVCIKISERNSHFSLKVGLIGLILFLFAYFKKYTFISFLPVISQPYFVIGLSYILFRVLSLLIGVFDREIKGKIGFFEFFNYTCFCLSFISGPIQHYQDFRKEVERPKKRLLNS